MKRLKNRYFLLRHGETIHQTEKKGTIYPYYWPERKPIPLTKKGEKKVRAVAKKLKKETIDAIYASDFFRTRQTAEIIVKELGLQIHYDKRIREINFGIYRGRLKKELLHDFPDGIDKFPLRPKEGESWNDVKKRMSNFIRDIERKYRNKTLLIISHGDPLWLLIGMLKGLSNEEMLKRKKKIYPDVAELVEIRVRDSSYEV